MASIQAASFYAELARPAWAPPGWLFGPVWTVLYGMMAVSVWLVWRRGGWAGAAGSGGVVIGAVSGMGELCCRAQLFGVATQSSGARLICC
ncbi:tryptophan-rich sensory protein [Xanthomonas fragariae LMG 25863]|nr:tryptophan-rich sensory protein [Xanthomonas fragariae LMG 25863]